MKHLVTLLLNLFFISVSYYAYSQGTLTLCDGWNHNNFSPLRNNCPHNQMIYPSTMLNPITGNHIGRIAFESPSGYNYYFPNDTVEVRIGICSDSIFNQASFDTTTPLTLVYRGPFSIIASPTITNHSYFTVVFDSLIQYNGGNLLIDVQNTLYNYNGDHNWNGINRTGATVHESFNGTISTTNILPKLIIDFQPSSICHYPDTVYVTDISGYSVGLSWPDEGSAQSWSVEYGLKQFTIGTGAKVFTQDTFTTISGLVPLTNYKFIIRAVCDTAESIYQQTFAKTGCGYIDNLPAMYNFNSQPQGDYSFINCWTRYCERFPPYSYNYPKIDLYTGLQDWLGANTNSLVWLHDPTLYGQQYAILPAIDTSIYNISEIQIRFKAKREMNQQYTIPLLEFGIIDSYEDTASFVPLDTISPISGIYLSAECLTINYTGNGTTLAFRTIPGDSTKWKMWMDNLEIIQAPPCIRVNADVFDDSLFVYWSSKGTETNWIIDFQDSIITVDTSCIGLGGLSTATEYNLNIYAIASSGDTLGPCPFSTTTLRASPVNELPYYCGFGNVEGLNWERDCSIGNTGKSVWRVGSSIYHDSTDFTALYVTPDSVDRYLYNNQRSTIFAFRAFNLAQGDYAYSYDWISGGEANFDYLRAAIFPASRPLLYEMTENWRHNTLPPNAISLDDDSALCMSRYWNNKNGHFHIDDSGIYYMVFFWRNDNLDCDGHSAAIDNVILSRYIYPDEGTLAVIDSGMSYIILNLESSSDAIWDLEYDKAGFVSGYGTTIHNVSNYIRIDGLDKNTVYDFIAKPLCSDSSIAITSLSLRFRIPVCDSTIINMPNELVNEYIYYNYNTLTDDNYPNSLSESIYYAEELGEATTFHAIAFNYSGRIMSYQHNNVDIYLMHTDRLNFSTDTNEYIPLDSATLVYHGQLNFNIGWNTFDFQNSFDFNGIDNLLIAVVDNSNTMEELKFETRNTGNTYRNWIIGSTGNIDISTFSPTDNNISKRRADIKLLSCCNRDCPMISRLTTEWTSFHSAKIIWDDNETLYNIQYKTHSDSNWIEIEIVNDTFLILDSLFTNTTYDLRISSICDAVSDRISSWVYTSFSTLNCPEIESFSVIDISTTCATLTIDNNEGSPFIIRYRIANDNEDFITDTIDFGNFVLVENLEPATQYEAQVCRICSSKSKNSETSDWSKSIYFTTDSSSSITTIPFVSETLFPNPANETITIMLDGYNGIAIIKMLYVDGRIVYQKEISIPTELSTVIDTRNLPSGIYFVITEYTYGKIIKKLVIKHSR